MRINNIVINMKKAIVIILALIMGLSTMGCNGKLEDIEDTTEYNDVLEFEDSFDATVASLSATDDFGRTFSSYSSLDNSRYVGIYYAVWLGEHPGEQNGIYNVTELLSTEESAKKLWATKESPDYDAAVAPQNKYYFWGEPLYGYYKSTDPWVMMRHLELLTMASIDFLYLDVTNGFSYLTPVKILLDTFKNMQEQGWRVPKVMFMCNSGSGDVTAQLYNGLYSGGEYDDLWFAPNGKPMISVMMNHDPEDMRETIENRYPDYFDVRGSVWPNYPLTDEQKADGFPWIDWNKFHTDYGGIMNVSVAQHVALPFSRSVFDPKEYNSNWGRGWDAKKNKNVPENVVRNENFEAQWEAKNKLDPDIITVTGWNEWIALKIPDGLNGIWVDNFNLEFSRDLEMSKGGHKDNAYLQLARNIRNRKGSAGDAKGYERTKLYAAQGIAQWRKGGAVYRDFGGDAIARLHKDFTNKNLLENDSNRNDITEVRIAHDLENVHFLIRTDNELIKDFSDGKFLNVLFGVEGGGNGFYGYQYRINGQISDDGKTSVEKSVGGYNFEKVGDATYRMGLDFMQISVPRELLGLGDVNREYSVDFKVTDNITHPEDIMDYYVSGDSAPIGRLSYNYKMKI